MKEEKIIKKVNKKKRVLKMNKKRKKDKKVMKNLSSILNILKNNKKEIQIIKILVIIAINTWLLIIFWKALLIDNVFMGNNIALTKMNTVIQPVLQILGLEVLSPNTIKMMIISMIVITANLMVLHFQKMIMIMITGIIARYSYKSYTNYLINSENMNQIAIQNQKIPQIITQKAVEQAPIVINTGASTGTNWWLWGTVIVVGAIAIGGIALMVWSHNTNANGIVELAENTRNLNQVTRSSVLNMNEKITRVAQQMKELDSANGKISNELKEINGLLNEKITNIEGEFQTFGTQISKLEENNIENVKILAQNTLEISTEAKEFFGNVLESNTATEALIVSIAKLVDGFNVVTERIVTVETRLDSMTGATTPRSSMAFRSIIPTKLNNPTNLNE